MLIPNSKLAYFAFPKCCSELIRQELKLKNTDFYIYNNWLACSPQYCHVKPSIYLRTFNGKTPIFFTVVRNTYERLVSAWAYLQEFNVVTEYDIRSAKDWRVVKQEKLFQNNTFEDFINAIYANRNDIKKLAMAWMYMPYETYFEGIEGNPNIEFHVFDSSHLEALNTFLTSHNIKAIDIQKKTNTSKHSHYSSYYNEDLLKKVNEIYAYEIKKFNYVFVNDTI